MSAETKRSATRVKGFNNEEMDFQLLRSLGVVPTGGGSIGEILTVAASTEDGDPDSWVESFAEMAEMVNQEAGRCLADDHLVSARDMFCRASQYFRAAEYFEDIDAPRHDELGIKSREAFLSAAELFDPPIEPVSVPYDPLPMPGYFAKSPQVDGPAPCLIINGGFDSSAEELYFQFGVEALKRGFHIFFFDGPGETGMMRLRPRLPFRHDWEAVISPVVDFVLSRPEVDPDKLALLGISFGGYLAPRAAAFEPRIKALIADSPITDWFAYMSGFFGPDGGDIPDFSLDYLKEATPQDFPPLQKQMLVHSFRKFGAESWNVYLEALKRFRLSPEDMARITCPTLACIGQGEGGEPKAQFDAFGETVGGPVTSHEFTIAWGVDAHCQLNNIARFGQKAYDWLSGLFGLKN
jgi:pimeloyl-ACP methyl ester carboxylesterase